MTVRLYADEFRCAIFDEAPGGGDPADPASLMNRPVVSPLSWLSNLYFHSDLNYYEIVKYASTSISHAAVPGIVRPAGGLQGTDVSAVTSYRGQTISTSHVLTTHNLGYVPRFFCIYDGKLIPHGTPVQAESGQRARFVSAYATPTQIRLFDNGKSSDSALPATSRTYQVIVFRTPDPIPSLDSLRISPGEVVFGKGKFKSDEPHLRADSLGDVQWPIATNRTAGVRNGSLRAFNPNGGHVDFGPYNGSLSAPTYITTSAGV